MNRLLDTLGAAAPLLAVALRALLAVRPTLLLAFMPAQTAAAPGIYATFHCAQAHTVARPGNGRFSRKGAA
ncbi:hypothetical protein [Streptomyces syringium]|uniref:Uncharacterized protein n=1 Tax=Streptomyces syringium TaxID=76729 RepID=A0ABS4XW52_9ACTN|nr:hypothetical protein [Streptomyces syringium]MBP2400744.1 hypothetical protein [Streptomyces syringium]